MNFIFVSCSRASCCLFFFHFSELSEAVFASLWRRIEPGEEIWAGSLTQGWGGKSSWVQRQPVPGSPGTAGSPACFPWVFLHPVNVLMLENWKYYLRKMWLQLQSWCWCWHWAVCPAWCCPVTLDLLGNKWIKGDCHWKSGRCLSQTGLGCFLYLCQYILKLGQYFSVCSFILALSRSFKRGLNMVPDDSF